MATLRVRYRTGDTDEWRLHERTDLEELHKVIAQSFEESEGIIGIGTEARSGVELDFAMVWIRMDEVMQWEMDDLLDEQRLAQWWQPGAFDPPADT